jgi:hypothetical protein
MMLYREVFAHNGPGPYTCYFGCGEQVTMEEVNVHHIDENRDNAAPSNLAAAHESCHMRKHRSHHNGSRKCPPDCRCGRHNRLKTR